MSLSVFWRRKRNQSRASRKIACTLVAPAYIFVPQSTARLLSRLLLHPFVFEQEDRAFFRWIRNRLLPGRLARHLNNGCGSWRGTPGSKTKWGGLLAKTRPASRGTPRASRHNDPAITKTRLWIKLWINHDHPLKGRNLHRRQDKNVVVSFHS